MESYMVDNIQLAAAAAHHEDNQIRYFSFYEGLAKVIEAMDLIKEEVMVMDIEKAGVKAELPRNVSVDAGIKSSSIERKSEMVGFDDVRLELLDRLTGGDSSRRIIPIVGMGGIGKTTLALNAFESKFVKEHFDVCLWATISQDYNIEQTLGEVLSQGGEKSSVGKSVGELGEKLHKYLFGRRYLVVLDDMWSIEVWDKMKFFFPDCSQRSRVIVTTRMSSLAAHLTNSSNTICMSFLNESDSWTLFSKTVFGSEGKSVAELREIGEKIVGKCKGLPLSIAVIGGLLAKSERTQEFWEYIEENLSSIVNLENEEYCLRVLKLSYNHLPIYLKPCFLYMGVFDEDSVIEVSTIINLWVSEGFLKPTKGKKNLEAVAREYFQELVDRNLILPNDEARRFPSGFTSWMVEFSKISRFCKMHDLVRDVCLREAQKQGFCYVYSKLHNPPPQETSSHYYRRIVIPCKNLVSYNLECWPNSRSYVCHNSFMNQFPDFRLLRSLLSTTPGFFNKYQMYRQEDVFRVLVNSRLLSINLEGDELLHSSISRLWSLHTLVVRCYVELKAPVEFWNMHQLKHVEFRRLRLQPPPPNNDNNIVVLENLQVLIGMVDFHLNEDVVSRMPNLTILEVFYQMKLGNEEVHCLSHLQRLTKLQSFCCGVHNESGENLQRICFPPSLNQILLSAFGSPQIELEDVLQKIGGLPFVEELILIGCSFRRGEWETIEGHFPRLKILQLLSFCNLQKWTVLEASHFPLLRNLILEYLKELEEIPSEIGEIATLRSIEVKDCSEAAVLSAKKIVQEQEELYGDEQLSFRVLVKCYYNEAPESLPTPNFQVETWR